MDAATQNVHNMAARIMGVQPIARGTIEEKGINPWVVLVQSRHEQSVLNHQRGNFRRAANRILTEPLDRLDSLPLLSNPGSLVLCATAWIPRDEATGKFVKVKADA